jgi:hypothetical protein
VRDVLIPIALAAWYFVSVYFAVAALWPPWAYPAGLIATILVMIVHQILAHTRRNTPFALALLAVIPTSCIAAGIIWWILRWLDLWVLPLDD